MRKDQVPTSDLLTNETHRGPLTIVYASQTGQAKCIAESLHDMALTHHFKPTLYDIAEHDKSFTFASIQSTPLVFVCSTTGDGETPESARKAYSRLRRADKDTMDLSALKYALLGLGDSNYSQFANGPKLFHKRLGELGATCFYGPFWADDGVGMEQVVEPFKEGVWSALESLITSSSSSSLSSSSNSHAAVENLESQLNNLALIDSSKLGSELTLPDLTECHMSIEFLDERDEKTSSCNATREGLLRTMHSKSPLYRAKVTSNQLLTSPESVKQTYGLKFRVVGGDDDEGDDESTSCIEYEPGHAIDIAVANSDREVDDLIRRLDLEKSRNQLISLKTLDATKKQGSDFVKIADANPNVTLFDFFKYCVDIRSNALKKAFIRMLAAYCTDNDSDRLRLLQLSSREGSDEYTKLVKECNLSLLDLLNTFKSCKPPVAHLIQMLPPLSTRAYSVCTRSNDPLIEIVFSMVEFPQENGRTYARNGVATNYLSQLKSEDKVFFQKRKFNSFTFPMGQEDDEKKPLILIGPGTGIAPYVSYLRQLKHKATDSGALCCPGRRLWLFFGCRRPDWDWLFREELCGGGGDGELKSHLDKFSVSFSRLESTDQVPADLSDRIATVSGCKYVQDLLRHYAAEIVRLIDTENALVYVCGDAKNMAKDVQSCLSECLQKHLQIDADQASKYLNDMIKSKRYKQDIWA